MKFKMHSLMPDKNEMKNMTVVEPSKPNPENSLPTIQLASDKIPEIEDCKVGDKCMLTFEAEIIGRQSGDLYGEKKDADETTARFRLHSASMQMMGKDKTGGKGYRNMDEAVKNASKDLS